MSQETQLRTAKMLAQDYRRFGLSEAWFKAEAEGGRIPCLRAGRRVLFDPAAVERALLERAGGAAEINPTNPLAENSEKQGERDA